MTAKDKAAAKSKGGRSLTPKQESFCLSYIETGNATESYRRVYNVERMKPETINRNAKAMIDSNKIATRLNELREPIQKRHQITVDDLIAELEEARQAAFQANNPQSSAAVAATMGKAKLLGFDIQKLEATVTTKELPVSVDEFI